MRVVDGYVLRADTKYFSELYGPDIHNREQPYGSDNICHTNFTVFENLSGMRPIILSLADFFSTKPSIWHLRIEIPDTTEETSELFENQRWPIALIGHQPQIEGTVFQEVCLFGTDRDVLDQFRTDKGYVEMRYNRMRPFESRDQVRFQMAILEIPNHWGMRLFPVHFELERI